MTGRQQPVPGSFVIIFTPSARRHTLKKTLLPYKACEECRCSADIESSDGLGDKGTCGVLRIFHVRFIIELIFCRQHIGFEYADGELHSI